MSRQVSFISRGAIEFLATLGADMGVIIVNLKLVSGLPRLGGQYQVTEPTLDVGLRSVPGPAVGRLVYLHAVTVLKTQPTDRTGNWTTSGVGMGLLMEPESSSVLVLFITQITLEGKGGVSGLVSLQMFFLCELFVTIITLE